MFNFKVLQEELKPWTEKNFGPVSKHKSYRPLLGMCEELGELMTASTGEDGLDAVADCMIFMADYCNQMGFDLDSLYKARLVYKPSLNSVNAELLRLVGKVQHHHLKLDQGIRGTDDKHTAAIQMLLSDLICVLYYYPLCNGQNGTKYYVPMYEVVETVWNKVKQRDFTKNKVTGEVCA